MPGAPLEPLAQAQEERPDRRAEDRRPDDRGQKRLQDEEAADEQQRQHDDRQRAVDLRGRFHVVVERLEVPPSYRSAAAPGATIKRVGRQWNELGVVVHGQLHPPGAPVRLRLLDPRSRRRHEVPLDEALADRARRPAASRWRRHRREDDRRAGREDEQLPRVERPAVDGRPIPRHVCGALRIARLEIRPRSRRERPMHVEQRRLHGKRRPSRRTLRPRRGAPTSRRTDTSEGRRRRRGGTRARTPRAPAAVPPTPGCRARDRHRVAPARTVRNA